MARTIAILTDFGYTDNYVGIMKGVIRKISPFADIFLIIQFFFALLTLE
jgi:S-adenosylmethionine hydrolase